MSRARFFRCSGASVLELMVGLVIVSSALAIAASLMSEAGRRSLIEQERTLQADVPLALRQIEIDVTAAAAGSGRSELGEPLALERPSGIEVTYELSGTKLLRRVSDVPGQRVVLDEVRRFRWQWLGGRKPLAVIELEYERIRPPGPEADEGRRVFGARRVENRTLELTLRGGGGVGW